MEQPLAAITVTSLLGYDSTSFVHLDPDMFAHSSWQIAKALTNWMVSVGEEQFSKSYHRF